MSFPSHPDDAQPASSNVNDTPASVSPPDQAGHQPPIGPVFISHSSRDADTAKLITDALESAGVRCWLAPRDIAPGHNWNSAIMTGINDSSALVFLLSRHSVESDPVTREVERAVARRIPVLPVRLESAKPSPALEYLISTFQWVDAFPPPVSRHVDSIVAAVKKLLSLRHDLPKRDPNAPPKYVGPYRIMEVLGEGGMGIVYKAEQQKPLKRAVAIKLIKLGLATNEVLGRFETERQALARMDNPHIAKVLDAGADEFGRPYFVMEYVPGVPITQFADENKLSIRQRLELFTQVCDAISHAHTKALIHRDVKAGNVLAYMADGKPVAKVIDFGIAKALTGDRLSDRTFNTERGLAIGSYEAMSPEQAEGSPDIDTRTDVYSLGALLYELLAGAKPIDPQSILKSADLEVRRIIREVDPPRPSARLSSLGNAGTAIATARRMNPEALATQLRSELEWIPLMAMRKDRQRRYVSPAELAEDIQNYLSNRPLKAGPESVSYRIRKAVRRNRTTIAVSAAFVLLVAIGTASYISGIRAEQRKTSNALDEVTDQKGKTELALTDVKAQKSKTDAVLTDLREQKSKTDAALVEVREQKTKVESALKDAKEQKNKAESALKEAEKAREAEWNQGEVTTIVNEILLRVLSSPDPNDESGDKLTVVQAIQAAVKDLDKNDLQSQPHVEARLRLTIGRTLRRLGHYDDAEPNLQRAIAIYRKIPGGTMMASRGFRPVGVAIADNEMIFGKHELAAALDELALLRAGQKKYAEAEALAREATKFVNMGLYGAQNKAECARIVASIFQQQQKLPEAEAAYKEAIEQAEKLLPNLFLDVARLMNDAGYVMQLQEKLPQAEQMYRDALQCARAAEPSDPEAGRQQTAKSLNNIARIVWLQGKRSDAETLYRELLNTLRKNLPAGHADIGLCLWNLGILLQEEGKSADAKPLHREAREIFRKALPPGHPSLVLSLNHLMNELSNEGKLAESEAAARELLEMLRKVRNPNDPDIMLALHNLGAVMFKEGKLADAEPLLNEALKLAKTNLSPDDPRLADYRSDLLNLLFQTNNGALAEPILRDDIKSRLNSKKPDPAEIYQSFLKLAIFQKNSKKNDEAVKSYREAIEYGRKAWPNGNARLATSIDNLASFLRDLGRLKEAEKLQIEALEMYRELLPEGHTDIGIALTNLAVTRIHEGNLREAETLATEASKIMRKNLPVENSMRTEVVVGLAIVLERQKKLVESEKLIREELSIAVDKLGAKAAATVTIAGYLADSLQRTGQSEKASKVRTEYGLPEPKKDPKKP
jgi:eukaryotic-like serine/threonine-protein kinase